MRWWRPTNRPRGCTAICGPETCTIDDEEGSPCLIDPAAYGGDREVDLAMMRLFGGFSRRVFAAYEEAWPLPAGHERRIPPSALSTAVHVNLFGGGGYAGSVESALTRVLSA